jgi:hypothetical protein
MSLLPASGYHGRPKMGKVEILKGTHLEVNTSHLHSDPAPPGSLRIPSFCNANESNMHRGPDDETGE